MTRLGRLERKVLIQTWFEELEMQKRHDPSLCFAELRTLHCKLENALSLDDEEQITISAWKAQRPNVVVFSYKKGSVQRST